MMIHLPQMLLQPAPASSKTLSNNFFFHSHLPRTLHFRRPSKFRRNLLLCRDSASFDTRILPQSAIQRIAEKLRSLGYVEDDDNSKRPSPPEKTLTTSPGEIFIPLPNRLPKSRVGHTLDSPLDRNWSTPENSVPEPGSGNAIKGHHELRGEVPTEKKEDKVKRREGRGSEEVPTLAELKLPGEELRRLRKLGIALKEKLKIGKAGITEGIVNGIHERWRRTELVKIECHDLCRLNMKRTHDLLERKTGGLVVWRSGGKIILYRGADYKYPYFFVKPNEASDDDSMSSSRDSEEGGAKESVSTGTDGVTSVAQTKIAQPSLIKGVGSRARVRFRLPGEAQLAEEADQLLQGLGPRFVDWYGYDPLPVDADLLPAVIPGYRKPFRLLPYGVQPTLTNDEMTMLRRLGRPLPCHFALSRNRKLQGLAAAILKLWEKCEIAKIAIKRGTQDANSELMAEELKWLTGGAVLARDKEYIVLYRGKDFLPATVSSAIEQRRNHGVPVPGNERKNVSSSSDALVNKDQGMDDSSSTKLGGPNDQKQDDFVEESKLRTSEVAIKSTSVELSQALMRKESAEKLLEELEKEEIGKQLEVDKEGITEEERYMLRRVGLKMKPFLLLGRRGVFDGIVENMHLHWKYRELVKILSGEKSTAEAHAIARTLEAESGGILVAVERVVKGHVIIVFRGKNYTRPASLRPKTLLNKREALKRSIEAQRRKSLKLHVLKLSRNVDELKLELAKSEEASNRQGENDWKGPLELEMKKSQSAEYMEPETDLELSKLIPTPDQQNKQATKLHGGDSMSLRKGDGMDASRESPETNCQDVSKDFSMELESEDSIASGVAELEIDTSTNNEQTRQLDVLNLSSVKLGNNNGREATEAGSKATSVIAKGTEEFVEMDNENDKSKLTASSTCPKDFKLEGLRSASNIGSTVPHVSVTQNDVPFADSPIHRSRVKQSTERPYRSALLSNRERLLLRKQALKMKKRPVLAVGKSNIVSGVAKTIRTHFQKHPLAIVNIKGRARGTSVQEVVSKLEEATGAIFVSQEPNKVILYRGWGATEDPNQTTGDKKGVSTTNSEGSAKPIISPELISAIRLECGLLHNEEDEGVS